MGGSAAETPTSPDEQPAAGLRASDADRDQVVSRLRDEYVAGRLSQETFLHRMNLVLETKRQVDLPPMLADLPQQTAGPARRRPVARRLAARHLVTGDGNDRQARRPARDSGTARARYRPAHRRACPRARAGHDHGHPGR